VFRVIDRYVARSFIFGYVVCLAGLAGLFIVWDTFANFDEWIENGGSLVDIVGRLVQYYIFSLPKIFALVAPFVTMLAGMFAVTTLNRFNELTPLKACGESIYRTVWPIFILAVVSAGLSTANQEIARPRATARIAGLMSNSPVVATGIIEQFEVADPDDPTVQLSGGQFNAAEKKITDVKLRRSTPEWRTHITADYAVYKGDDNGYGRWHLYGNVKEQRSEADGMPLPGAVHSEYVVERIRPDEPAEPFQIRSNITPDEIQVLHDPKLLSTVPTAQLARLARRHPGDRRLNTQLQQRFAQPIVGLVLLLLGLPFVLHSSSRVFVFGLGACVCIAAAYLFVARICEQMSFTGSLSPLVGAWAPTVLFGALGIVMFDMVRT